MDFKEYYEYILLNIKHYISKEEKILIEDKIEESKEIKELYNYIFQNSSFIREEKHLEILKKSKILKRIILFLIKYDRFEQPEVLNTNFDSIDIQKILLKYELSISNYIFNFLHVKYIENLFNICICYESYTFQSYLCKIHHCFDLKSFTKIELQDLLKN